VESERAANTMWAHAKCMWVLPAVAACGASQSVPSHLTTVNVPYLAQALHVPSLAPTTAPRADVLLDGLVLGLGPDLRALFPVVLNVGISGQLRLCGRPDAASLQPSGVLRLDSGLLNLVATQFALARDHSNSLTFTPDTGLDPLLDLALVAMGGDLRAAIQVCGVDRAAAVVG
jgi:TamB, inner membrane protein subunit of TAM complex